MKANNIGALIGSILTLAAAGMLLKNSGPAVDLLGGFTSNLTSAGAAISNF